MFVDNQDLRSLLPEGGLDELAIALPPDENEVVGIHWTEPGPTDSQAAQLLRRASGASSPAEFGELDVTTQRRAIAELRTRSVPYARIAKATGMSISRVRRMHLAGA